MIASEHLNKLHTVTNDDKNHSEWETGETTRKIEFQPQCSVMSLKPGIHLFIRQMLTGCPP